MNSDYTYAYFSGDYDEMDRLEIEHCLDGFSIHSIATGYLPDPICFEVDLID